MTNTRKWRWCLNKNVKTRVVDQKDKLEIPILKVQLLISSTNYQLSSSKYFEMQLAGEYVESHQVYLV